MASVLVLLSLLACAAGQTIQTVNGTIVLSSFGATMTLASDCAGSRSAASANGVLAYQSDLQAATSTQMQMITVTNSRLDSQFGYFQSTAAAQQTTISTSVNAQMATVNTVLSTQQVTVDSRLSNMQGTVSTQANLISQLSSQLAATQAQTSNALSALNTQTIAASTTTAALQTLMSAQQVNVVSQLNTLGGTTESLQTALSQLAQSTSVVAIQSQNLSNILGELTRITTTTTTTTTAPPSYTLCSSAPGEGTYTINPGSVTPFLGYCANQASDANGYLLIAQVDQYTSTLKWNDLTVASGQLSRNQKLSDSQINAAWNNPISERRMLIRCTFGGTWGSAVASNWFGGSFNSNFRSNCLYWSGNQFYYGATINGYGDSWYQQNGSGGCLHGNYNSLGMSSLPSGVTCSGDIQFLIR